MKPFLRQVRGFDPITRIGCDRCRQLTMANGMWVADFWRVVPWGGREFSSQIVCPDCLPELEAFVAMHALEEA